MLIYRPTPGSECLFEEGYRRHLAWHREHADPLPWFGWSVVSGDRLGLFVDGTFGVSFRALDERVEPAADRADFEQTTAPFATPVSRRGYRLRRDLGTSTRLEDGNPSRFVEVLEVGLQPGATQDVEAVLRRLRQEQGIREYACYELAVGGDHPTYLLMVPHAGLGDYDADQAAVRAWLADTIPAGLVRRIRSETWAYRPDLSLLPPR